MKLLAFSNGDGLGLGVRTDAGVIDVVAAAAALGGEGVPRSIDEAVAGGAAARAALDGAGRAGRGAARGVAAGRGGAGAGAVRAQPRQDRLRRPQLPQARRRIEPADPPDAGALLQVPQHDRGAERAGAAATGRGRIRLRGRARRRHRPRGTQRLRGGRPRPRLRLLHRQRRLLPRPPDPDEPVAARQDARQVPADWPLARHRRRGGRPPGPHPADLAQRYAPPGLDHGRHDLLRPRDRVLRQQALPAEPAT
jgi:hypothetical protein